MQKRIEWIDCAKLIAMMAVVTDHCNGFLYSRPTIANASYFSVSLFVLLSSISTWVAYERGKDISFISQFEKVKKIFFTYAVATFIVLCIIQRRFDLKTYLSYLVGFNIQGPYYYLVFFFTAYDDCSHISKLVPICKWQEMQMGHAFGDHRFSWMVCLYRY